MKHCLVVREQSTHIVIYMVCPESDQTIDSLEASAMSKWCIGL